jgi:hypothetical protein
MEEVGPVRHFDILVICNIVVTYFVEIEQCSLGVCQQIDIDLTRRGIKTQQSIIGCVRPVAGVFPKAAAAFIGVVFAVVQFPQNEFVVFRGSSIVFEYGKVYAGQCCILHLHFFSICTGHYGCRHALGQAEGQPHCHCAPFFIHLERYFAFYCPFFVHTRCCQCSGQYQASCCYVFYESFHIYPFFFLVEINVSASGFPCCHHPVELKFYISFHVDARKDLNFVIGIYFR